MPDDDPRFRPPVDRFEQVIFGNRIPVSRQARRRTVRKRYTAAERHVQILEAVIPVFAARGYARATVSRLEAVVPVSRPTMYGYFPSKAKLYAAALAYEADRVEAVLLPALEGAFARDLLLPAVLQAGASGHAGADGDPGAAAERGPVPRVSDLDPLSRVVDALVRWARRNPDSARLLLQRPINEDEIVAAHAAVRTRAVDRIAALLRRDPTITAQRGLQRRFALRLHAEMLVGAAEAVLLWALEHPLVPARHLARTWTAPPRDGLARAGRRPHTERPAPATDAARAPPGAET